MGPAPGRKHHTTWAQFIRRHKELLWATDFFTAEFWTATGLTTFHILFFLHLQTRRVILGGITHTGCRQGAIRKSERLGGLLNFYHRAAA